jgi:uncharacterized RmlC-like cupin family protein
MGNGQMLRVSRVEGWLARQRAAGSALVPGDQGDCLIVRPGGPLTGSPSPAAPVPFPGEHGPVHRESTGYLGNTLDCRRSREDQRPGGSGPSSGAQALRLHLVMLAPGTRGEPHVHAATETAVYLVSGEAEVWHGTGLAKRSTVRAGDMIRVPAGAPHLAVNRGDVSAIAVIARSDPPERGGTVVIELPRHLVGLAGIPVGSDR